MIRRWLNKARAWMERLSHHRYAEGIMYFLSFIESSFFPLPVDLMLVPMVVGRPRRWVRFAIGVTLSSVLGGLFGYLIGSALYNTVGIKIITTFNLEHHVEAVRVWFNRGTFLAMFVSSFTPIPFKLFTIAGGLFKVKIIPFVIASVIGRGARFGIESFIAHKTREELSIRRHPMIYILVGVIVIVATIFLFVQR
jgi:membrane protein YqaA with SNARE-associated domain